MLEAKDAWALTEQSILSSEHQEKVEATLAHVEVAVKKAAGIKQARTRVSLVTCESQVEEAVTARLASLGYKVRKGSDDWTYIYWGYLGKTQS